MKTFGTDHPGPGQYFHDRKDRMIARLAHNSKLTSRNKSPLHRDEEPTKKIKAQDQRFGETDEQGDPKKSKRSLAWGGGGK